MVNLEKIGSEERRMQCEDCAHSNVCAFREEYIELYNDIANRLYHCKNGSVFSAKLHCAHSSLNLPTFRTLQSSLEP